MITDSKVCPKCKHVISTFYGKPSCACRNSAIIWAKNTKAINKAIKGGQMMLVKRPSNYDRCGKCGSKVQIGPKGPRADGTNRPCEVLCACISGLLRNPMRLVRGGKK